MSWGRAGLLSHTAGPGAASGQGSASSLLPAPGRANVAWLAVRMAAHADGGVPGRAAHTWREEERRLPPLSAVSRMGASVAFMRGLLLQEKGKVGTGDLVASDRKWGARAPSPWRDAFLPVGQEQCVSRGMAGGQRQGLSPSSTCSAHGQRDRGGVPPDTSTSPPSRRFVSEVRPTWLTAQIPPALTLSPPPLWVLLWC